MFVIVCSLERSVDMIKITPDHIDQELITKYVSDPTAGAISSFIGMYVLMYACILLLMYACINVCMYIIIDVCMY